MSPRPMAHRTVRIERQGDPQWWACGITGSRDRNDWWPCFTHPPAALFIDGWQVFLGTEDELDALTLTDDQGLWSRGQA